MNRPDLEAAFSEAYSFKPVIDYQVTDRGAYDVKLSYNGKTVTLSEVMKGGKTHLAFLEYEGVKTRFETYRAAELAAVNILRGE